MAATQFAADTPLLVTGMIATAGIFSLWRLWIYALAFLLMGFLLAGSWRRAGVLTDAELAELRYGGRLATALRGIKAVYFGLIFNCTVMAMVLFAATRIAEPFLHWDLWLPASAFSPVVKLVQWVGLSLTANPSSPQWAEHSASNLLSLLAILSVTTLYSTTGGLRAVVDTDVVQLAVALLGTLLYAGFVVMQVGGLHALRQKLAGLYGTAQTNQLLSFTPDGARDASLAVLGVIAIQWLAQMNSDGTGYLAQRTMACRSDRDARGAALIFVGTQVLLRSLLWLPIGLGLLVLIPGLGDSAALDSAHYRALREASYVDGIARFLPAGVRGLLLTGMFAALASTLDTHLNWGASYFANDVYKRLYCEVWRQRVPSQRALVWIARASNGVILLVSLLILTRLQSVGSAWSLSLLLGAGMGVPLLLRWLWWRVTAASELAAIAGSALAAPLLLWQVSGDAARLLWMTLITSSLAVLAALWSPPEVTPGLREFNRRVQPPGFWRPVALAIGQDPGLARQRLLHGLLSTLCAATVVFGLLVVLGSLLVQAPKPAWMPSQGVWLGLVCAGTALAAWGLRKLGHAEDDVALQPSQP